MRPPLNDATSVPLSLWPQALKTVPSVGLVPGRKYTTPVGSTVTTSPKQRAPASPACVNCRGASVLDARGQQHHLVWRRRSRCAPQGAVPASAPQRPVTGPAGRRVQTAGRRLSAPHAGYASDAEYPRTQVDADAGSPLLRRRCWAAATARQRKRRGGAERSRGQQPHGVSRSSARRPISASFARSRAAQQGGDDQAVQATPGSAAARPTVRPGP